MSNSSLQRAASVAAALALSAVTTLAAAQRVVAQPVVEGFAVERLYPSAPGGGWFVMDALDMRGTLGAGMQLTLSNAIRPLRLTQGTQALSVVAEQAVADFGFAVTYDRYRVYLNMDMPLVTKGDRGTFGGYKYNANSINPTSLSVDLGSNPDTLSDARIGFDARLLGAHDSPFRLGAGAQVFFPNGRRADYDTDNTFRGQLRILAAGDVGSLAYAAHVGVHLRPVNETAAPASTPIPGTPQGSELLFGVATGLRLPLGNSGKLDVIIGPEIFGATACKSLFDTQYTALEALLSSRLEEDIQDGIGARFKVGAGVGLNPHFGAPEGRMVLSFEVFDHSSDRDKDGITDSRDACPDAPGPKTSDPKTNGCPPTRSETTPRATDGAAPAALSGDRGDAKAK